MFTKPIQPITWPTLSLSLRQLAAAAAIGPVTATSAASAANAANVKVTVKIEYLAPANSVSYAA